MGCGGSRADAIEPRYYESWTRETESTWLTYTDSDSPPSAAAADSGAEAGGLHAGECAGSCRVQALGGWGRRREAGREQAPGQLVLQRIRWDGEGGR